jgi:uncharacterized delta-60 repeat protein
MNASERRIITVLMVVASATLLPTASQARLAEPNTAGDLDPTFGQNGMVSTDLGPSDSADSVGIQPDGKIVVAGEVAYGDEFGLARYNPDGTLDATFGTSGMVTTDISALGAYAMAIQMDGRIVVAGGDRRFALIRYMPDGTLDNTFGGNGLVTTNFNPHYDLAYGVAIQADGKIVAVGVTSIVSRPHFDDTKIAIARYDTDGSLDTSFGGDGRVTTNFTGTYDAAYAVVMQTDGRIVVAGTADAYRRVALARYNQDGTRDPTFGDDGRVTTRFRPRTESWATAITVQADGRLVAVGTEPMSAGFGVIRYRTNGALDRTFSEDGKVTTDFLSRHDLGYSGGWARGVAIQSDGKIVVGGGAPVGTGGDTEFALARYQPDGTLDTSFGGDGRVTTEWSIDGNDSAFAIAIQTDGKIVATGRSSDGPDGAFALARYLP